MCIKEIIFIIITIVPFIVGFIANDFDEPAQNVASFDTIKTDNHDFPILLKTQQLYIMKNEPRKLAAILYRRKPYQRKPYRRSPPRRKPFITKNAKRIPYRRKPQRRRPYGYGPLKRN